VFSLTVPLTFRQNLIIKKVTCCNLEVESVVDTGAGISVISPELSDRLRLKSYGWEGRFVLLANGQKVYPKTWVNLPITVEDRQIVIQPVVMDINGFDLLLGNDALRQLQKIQIDYTEGEAKI
jgi:predicted aspartyl protease